MELSSIAGQKEQGTEPNQIPDLTEYSIKTWYKTVPGTRPLQIQNPIQDWTNVTMQLTLEPTMATRFLHLWYWLSLLRSGLLLFWSGLLPLWSGFLPLRSWFLLSWSGLLLFWSGLLPLWSGLLPLWSGFLPLRSWFLLLWSGVPCQFYSATCCRVAPELEAQDISRICLDKLPHKMMCKYT